MVASHWTVRLCSGACDDRCADVCAQLQGLARNRVVLLMKWRTSSLTRCVGLGGVLPFSGTAYHQACGLVRSPISLTGAATLPKASALVSHRPGGGQAALAR